MCNACTHIATYASKKEYDPTRTLTLRRAFIADFNRRFARIRRAMREAVITNDVLGLSKDAVIKANVAVPPPNAFAFPTTQAKVAAFMQWMKQLVDDNLIQVADFTQVGTSVNAAWTNKYVYDSYKRGVMRGNIELRNAGYNVPPIDPKSIDAMLMQPIHFDRLGVLYTRTFSELRNVTQAMDYQISTVLTQGLINGDGMYATARKLDKVITGAGGKLDLEISYINKNGKQVNYIMPAKRRAEMIARTETIRAHHIGTIQEYKNWELAGVYVRAEWQTAGDGRVCEVCQGLEGQRFSLKDIEGMIPVHPNCRCIALPEKINEPSQSKVDKTTEAGYPTIPVTALSKLKNPQIGKIYRVPSEDLAIEVYDDKVVAKYVKQIQAGKTPTPSFVDVDDLPTLMDGNHRAAAYQQLGMPVPIVPANRIDMFMKLGAENMTPEQYLQYLILQLTK